MDQIGFALIGCGGITLQNHLPGLSLSPHARLVALCDVDAASLDKARRKTGVNVFSCDYQEILKRDDVDAVIIATPNVLHAQIVLAAIAAGKHVLCEKPLAMNFGEALEMYHAAEAARVRHMTAFTYRFVPAMRYLTHLVRAGDLGYPFHFRSCRLQDWGTRALGWRQIADLAGTGELGDMLSHRIDFAHLLFGKMDQIVAHTRRFIDDRQGQPSELEDWVAILAEFANSATGVLESSKMATGRNESWRSKDYVEINGSERTFVFFTERWNELLMGKPGGMGLEKIPVPEEFWKLPNAPRDVHEGDPLVSFRYDQNFEFIDAILQNRPCVPSFRDGAMAQAVIDSAILSAQERRWIDLGAKWKEIEPPARSRPVSA